MANGILPTQEHADEILDIIDSYIDVKEAVYDAKFEKWWSEKRDYCGIPESAKDYCRHAFIGALT